MKTHIVAALLGAATGAWYVQGWRMAGQVQAGKTTIESLKREHAESLTRATGSALNATIRWQKEKDDALVRAQERAKLQAAGALAARRSADRLRGSLASASQRLPSAAHTACTEYAATASGLLGQCTAAYQELGAAADGHALDVRTLTESWPMSPPRPDAGKPTERLK